MSYKGVHCMNDTNKDNNIHTKLDKVFKQLADAQKLADEIRYALWIKYPDMNKLNTINGLLTWIRNVIDTLTQALNTDQINENTLMQVITTLDVIADIVEGLDLTLDNKFIIEQLIKIDLVFKKILKAIEELRDVRVMVIQLEDKLRDLEHKLKTMDSKQ